MSRKLIIDSSSIINFIKYHCFDKHEKGVIYNKLETFILSRIKKEEIIIIDKVLKELRSPETRDFKDKIKQYRYNTEHLLDKIEPLFEDNLVQIYAKNCDEWELESQRSQYSSIYADLYLIAVCEEFEKQNNEVILISEEVISSDNKIVEKIPTICERKEIECRNLPYLLFTIFKNELIFDLEVKN